MEKYILTLDQGTTSSRAILFDHRGKIASIAQKEFPQYYPHSGWVEHDAMEIWSSQASVITEAVSQGAFNPTQIAAVGITNQRETTIVWNRETGTPVYNAIVWQDRRTSDYCEELKQKGLEQKIQEKTGLIIDSYFSATKIRWILKNVEGAQKLADDGKLAFGTVDSWLIWNLTDGKEHITDVSNASRTLIYNINDMQWDQDLLDLFEIPNSMLPTVKSSSELYASTSGQLLGTKVPIAGIAGDQQAALFGQLCTEKGMVKNTYGTGCFMLMNIGDKPVMSKNNLITTVAWKIGEEVTYAFEGSIFMAGAIVQWLRDELKIIKTSAEVESLAKKVSDNGGVYMVPAFTGLGAPHWNQQARAAIFGMSRGSNDSHIARASLESIAFQTMDVLDAMRTDANLEIKELRVDGGATENNLLLQFQANVIQCNVIRPEITETTAIGAAYLAGLAVGFWGSIDELQSQWQKDRVFNPEEKDTDSLISEWKRAVSAVLVWADDKSETKN